MRILLAGALAIIAATAAQAAEFSQQVVRINPRSGEASPSATLADCIAEDFCLAQLTFAIGRVGGNPGLLNGPQRAPRIAALGTSMRYDFAPPDGERFCRAELVKLSVAPTFEGNATAMRFEASRDAVSIAITLPDQAPRAWFDGILILIGSSSDDGCTLTAETRVYRCTGRCGTVRF
jgi:hypothetical protein